MATPRGDPCGGVPGGDLGELRSPPQSYHEYKRCRFELYGTLDKYLS